MLRWSFGLAFPQPWATVAVNVIGSFVLAFLSHPALGVGDSWRVALCTGAMGGFTTYSTFNFQLFGALHEHAWAVGSSATVRHALRLSGRWRGGMVPGWLVAVPGVVRWSPVGRESP